MNILKILSLGLAWLLLLPITAAAETVSIPIFASYALMQQLMQRELFKTPDHTAVFAADKSGCTTVSFAKPELSGVEALLQVRADVDVKLGLPSGGKKCTVLSQWSGSTALKGSPIVAGAESLAVQFKVVDAQVYDAGGMQMKGGFIKQALQSRLHPLLDQFKLDLEPALGRAKTLLPSVLKGYSAEQVTHLFDSLHIGDVKAESGGLKINVQMDALNPNVIEGLAGTALKDTEKSALPSAAQDWDVFLSAIVKQMSNKTKSPEMREALLEVLQDARAQLQGAAHQHKSSGPDPLKQVFINSWERLAPLARSMSAKAPHQDLLELLSFVSAPDLLETLDALGTGLGIDISVDGLQKLVHLLNNKAQANAVKT